LYNDTVMFGNKQPEPREFAEGPFTGFEPHPEGSPTLRMGPDGPQILVDSLTSPDREWVPVWGGEQQPLGHYVVASMAEVDPPTETTSAYEAITECAAINADKVKGAIAEADPLKQVALLPIQGYELDEDHELIDKPFSWAQRQYVVEVQGGDDDVPEENIGPWLDPVNVAMRYSMLRQLGMDYDGLIDTPEQMLDVQYAKREDGTLGVWAQIGVLPGPDGWTIRTIRTTEQALKENGVVDDDKLPTHFFQIVACPPKNPLDTVFYKDSGKADARTIADEGEADIIDAQRRGNQVTQPMTAVRPKNLLAVIKAHKNKA
jgi:hypothetical protein